MRARVVLEWLQKHPTPRAAGGDFHWYPGALDAALRAELAERAAGDLSIWLEPGRVVLARRFADVAPGDGRRYTGLAVVVATSPDGASAATLLGVAPAPAHGPWTAGVDARPRDLVVDERAPMAPCDDVAPALVDAQWDGGACRAVEAAPSTCAAIETWLPDDVRATARRITVGTGAAAPSGLARWLAGALGSHGARLTRARRLWSALAAPRATFAALDALDAAWTGADALRAYLAVELPPRARTGGGADGQFARALHAAGRGWLSPAARDRIADVLALRALADHLDLDGAPRWRAVLHRECLLPADAARDLERAAIARVPLLAEAPHA